MTSILNLCNTANYNASAIWNGSPKTTTVGTNGQASYYGTFDQSGNIREIISSSSSSFIRLRGGSFLDSQASLSRVSGVSVAATNAYSNLIGCRLCSSGDYDANFVYIGNTGNAPDSDTSLGAVNYEFYINKYEIVYSDYILFLNTIATTRSNLDLNLWIPDDGNNPIARRGNGNTVPFSYTIDINLLNKPVSIINWFSIARYCNWLHNDKSTDINTTENGAYNFAVSRQISGPIFAKNSNAKYWIPSEDEWYKAAYYDPNKNGLGAPGYWNYATKSDAAPINIQADSVGNGWFSYSSPLLSCITATPTPTTTKTATPTRTPTISITASRTPTKTATASRTPTTTKTSTPTNTPSRSVTKTITPTKSITKTPTKTPTTTPTNTPSLSVTRTVTPTPTNTPTPTRTPTTSLCDQITLGDLIYQNDVYFNDPITVLYKGFQIVGKIVPDISVLYEPPTVSNTPTPSVTASNTPTPSITPTHSPTPSITATNTSTPTNTATLTKTPTNSSTPTKTATMTVSPTKTPTMTHTPSATKPRSDNLSLLAIPNGKLFDTSLVNTIAVSDTGVNSWNFASLPESGRWSSAIRYVDNTGVIVIADNNSNRILRSSGNINSWTSITPTNLVDYAGGINMIYNTAQASVPDNNIISGIHIILSKTKDYIYSTTNGDSWTQGLAPPYIFEFGCSSPRIFINKTNLTANLTVGSNIVTLLSGDTYGMQIGQRLRKLSGGTVGAFGNNARVASIVNATTFTTSINHSTGGSITFNLDDFASLCAIVSPSSNVLVYSYIGTGSWTVRSLPSASPKLWKDIQYINDQFVLLGHNENNIQVIPRLDTNLVWTSVSLPGSNLWNSIAYGNNRYIIIASDLSVCYVATGSSLNNSTIWTPHNLGTPPSTSWRKIVYLNNKFIVFGSKNFVLVSSDGIQWTPQYLESSSSVAYSWISIV